MCNVFDRNGLMSAVFLVGGAVRDILLGREPHDRDYVVIGSTVEEMLQKGYKQVGKDFPVFLDENGEEYALARKEKKIGDNHTDFEFIFDPSVTLEEDLLRRDFTFNAIFFRIKKDKFNKVKGKIVDYQNGITALINREIKAVGKPEDRFIEDPLRMLRAIRQKNQLGFTIEKNTWDSIKRLMPELITTVSSERISVEIIKSFEANPLNSLLDFEKSSFSEIAEYEIKQRMNNIEKYSKENGKRVKTINEPEFYMQEKITEIIKRLSLPNQKYIYYAIYVMTVFTNLDKIEYPEAVIEEVLRDCPEKDEIILNKFIGGIELESELDNPYYFKLPEENLELSNFFYNLVKIYRKKATGLILKLGLENDYVSTTISVSPTNKYISLIIRYFNPETFTNFFELLYKIEFTNKMFIDLTIANHNILFEALKYIDEIKNEYGFFLAYDKIVAIVIGIILLCIISILAPGALAYLGSFSAAALTIIHGYEVPLPLY